MISAALVEAAALVASERRYQALAVAHAELLERVRQHEAWLDELVPPVQGGPRLSPAEQRERLAELVRERGDLVAQGVGPERRHLVTMRVDGLAVFETVRQALEDAGSVVDDTVVDEDREIAKEVCEIVVEVVMEALTRERLRFIVASAPTPDAASPSAAPSQAVGKCPGCDKPIRDGDEVHTEDDEVAGLMTWHRECFEVDAAPAPPDVLYDMLSLVMDGAHPPVEVIATWTDHERGEAERWAAHEHLIASDHDDVERLPRPVCLAPRTADGRTAATMHGYESEGSEG